MKSINSKEKILYYLSKFTFPSNGKQLRDEFSKLIEREEYKKAFLVLEKIINEYPTIKLELDEEIEYYYWDYVN